MKEDIELRKAIIFNRLKEMDALIFNLSPEREIYESSKEDNENLDLFIKIQRATVLLPTTAGRLKQLVDSKLKITDVARMYGLKVKGNKIVCPFHNDTDPSLSLSDKKNVFFCFGCGIKGDTIEFIRRLEEIGYKTTGN